MLINSCHLFSGILLFYRYLLNYQILHTTCPSRVLLLIGLQLTTPNTFMNIIITIIFHRIGYVFQLVSLCNVTAHVYTRLVTQFFDLTTNFVISSLNTHSCLHIAIIPTLFYTPILPFLILNVFYRYANDNVQDNN